MLPRFLLLLASSGILFAAPTITTASLPNGRVGAAYNRTITVSGAHGTVTWSVASGSLPDGLSLGESNGQIAGTPTTAGTSTFSIRATDQDGSDTQAYAVRIDPAPLAITTTSLPDATFNAPYSQTLTATGGAGGYSWFRSGGALPNGLSLSISGTISGTPTEAGNFRFSVTVIDNQARTDSQQLSITVAAPTLSVVTDSLPNGTVGSPYSQSLSATGGTGGYSWTEAGKLPAGLSLSPSGNITGTPSAAGAATFTVTVKDSGNRTADKQLSITVDPAAPTVTTASLPGGQVGQPYSQTLQASGGSGGNTWSIASGALPAGLNLSAAGEIAGTPSAPGTANFTASVKDSGGRTGTKALSIAIAAAPVTVTTAALPNGQVGAPYSQALEASGGAGGYTWSATGPLPAGLQLSPAGTISGTPSAAGARTFTVTATDSANKTGSKSLTLTVDPPSLSITTASLPNGGVGTPYSATVEATGGSGGNQFSVSAGALPEGLSMTAAGAISGTPTAAGAANFTVTVKDNGNRTASKQLTINIDPPALTITTTALPNGVVGTDYTTNVEASGGGGGNQFSVSAGALPEGLSINAAGAITGKPTAAGAARFTVTVKDNGNRTASKQLTINVDPPALTITTASLPDGVVGTAYSATVEAAGGSGGNQFSISAGALPAGLSINQAGAVTGTPSSPGPATFTVTVKDNGTRTASKEFKITIEPPGLVITTNSLPNGVVGSAYTGTVEATGGGGGNQFSVSAGSLPAGLSMSAAGAITGTPTAAGASNFTVAVKDNGNRSASKQLTINVDPPTLTITTASLPNGVAGVPYSATVEASGGGGGNQFSVTSGSLPAGLSLSAAGAITGTPTTAGAEAFTVTVKDNGNRTASKPFTVTIDPPTLAITTASLVNAMVGVPYSGAIQASGGSGGKKFSVTAGSLPAGLSMSAAGAITGTPTATGTSNFTATVTDSANKTATKAYTLTVDPPTLTITTSALPAGFAGSQYTQTLTAVGGAGGNSWSLSAGTLPPGLNLTGAGVISGTPTAAGQSNFTAQVKDSAGATATRVFTLTVNPPAISIATTSLPSAVEGSAYSQNLNATGGTGAYKWSLSAGSLPAGLNLEAGGRIAGTVTGASSTFTVSVQDGAGATATRNLTITVTAPLNLPPSTSLPTGVTGTTYSGTIKPTGGQAPYTFSVSSGQLPPGLTLNAKTGEIAGRPTQVGNFTFSLQVKDAAGGETQSNYTVAIANTLTITNPPVLPSGSVGVAYSVALIAAGGTAPYNFSATAGSLPAGLNFRADGTIDGTPTSAGTFTLTATVVDAVGGRTSKELTLTVAASLTITTASPLPSGVPGSPYNAPLAATGGIAPYTWTVASGSLAAGLRLDPATGAITGVPDAPTTANFTVAVTDSANVSAQKPFTLTITPGVTFTNPANLPDAVAGTPYTFTFGASGGRAPYTWRISDGALPAGLSLNATSGVASGTPSAAGTFNFTVEATDAAGLKGTRVHTLVVNLPSVATLTLSGMPATLGALQQPQVDVVIANPYPVPITGRLNLAFAPATGMPDDPSVQFSTGGRSVTFTIAANDTRATFSVPRLLIQSGSVAGAIQFTVESLRAGNDTLPNPTAPIGSTQIPASVPVVKTVEVRRNAGGFDLVVTGASTNRELTGMTVRFRPPAGATLQTTEVTVPLTDPATAWFTGSGSAQFGGQFTITLPFTFQGGPSSIETVAVVLTNSLGNSEEASGPY